MSDRAKALINLAQKRNKVQSVADFFHFKYDINKLLSLSLASKLRASFKNLESSKQTAEPKQIEIHEETHAHNQFYTDFYVETMNNFTMILHPYYGGNKLNNSKKIELEINEEISKIETIVSDCNIKDKYNLLKKAKNQVTDLVSVVDIWTDTVSSHIKKLSLTAEQQKWFTTTLLPKTYWRWSLKRTKYKITKNRLKEELSKCSDNSIDKPTSISKELDIELKTKAEELCRKFQRTSSQVEGRNGYLSMINHNQRSFDENRLKVLTVVHNFDICGLDGKTPAERLFGDKIKHDKIIDYLIQNFSELPLPRKRRRQVIDY